MYNIIVLKLENKIECVYISLSLERNEKIICLLQQINILFRMGPYSIVLIFMKKIFYVDEFCY